MRAFARPRELLGRDTRKLSAGSMESLLMLDAAVYLDVSDPALDDVRLEVVVVDLVQAEKSVLCRSYAAYQLPKYDACASISAGVDIGT